MHFRGVWDGVQEQFDDLLEHGGVHVVFDEFAFAFRNDQARGPQHRQMPRDGRPAAVEGVGDVAGRASSFPEQAQDAPAGGIGERAERPIRCHDVGMIS